MSLKASSTESYVFLSHPRGDVVLEAASSDPVTIQNRTYESGTHKVQPPAAGEEAPAEGEEAPAGAAQPAYA